MKFKIKKDKMLPHQLKWWNLTNFYPLLIGGYGCGKTYIGGLRSLYLSYINAPIPGMYISPSYTLSQKTIVITLKEIMDRSEIDYTYNQQRNEFRVHNWDGVIWIGSGDKPDSLRGPNLAWAGIDEPFIQKKDVFDQMIARVRHPDADKREVFLTGTPEELNWGYQLATRTDMDMGIVIGSTLDNTHLPQEYKDNLLTAYSDEQIQAYVHGQFVNLTQGRVYKEFSRELVTSLKTDGWEIGAGIDFNVDALTAIVFAHSKTHLHVFDEIRLRNAGTYDLAKELKEKYPGIKVYPDATGSARKTSAASTDHEILIQAGFKLMSGKSNPPVRDRVNCVNRVLRKNMVTVENCPNLIMDLERNVWRNGDIDKRDPDQTHASDAFGYACHWLFPLVSRKVGYSKW